MQLNVKYIQLLQSDKINLTCTQRPSLVLNASKVVVIQVLTSLLVRVHAARSGLGTLLSSLEPVISPS
jgi:hypothetical protein